MVMNAIPLAHGVLALKLEGTVETIDAFILGLDGVKLLTATETNHLIGHDEDTQEAILLVQLVEGKE